MRKRDPLRSAGSGPDRKLRAQQAAVMGVRQLARPAAVLALLLPAAMAWADGQIKFKVLNAKTKEPLPGAVIKIDPAPSEIDDLQFSTTSAGTVTTGDLASGDRTFTVTAIVNGLVFKPFKGKVSVVDNQAVDVEIQLEEQGFKVVDVNEKILRINLNDTSQSTFRDRTFFDLFPVIGINRQNLFRGLRSVPGMVPDSINRLHARGEEGGIALYIDGFQLPNFLTGATSHLITSDMLETMSVRTGGFSAEHGGASGAVLDIGLRPAINHDPKHPMAPQIAYRLGGGGLGAADAGVTISRQRGAVPGKNGDIGYFISLSRNSIGSILESPQGDRQKANNGGTTDNIFAKMEMQIGPSTEIHSLFGVGSSNNGIANRTGLGNQFRPQQGFGFSGDDVRENYLVTQNGQTIALNQDNDGNRIFQKDNNRFFVTQYRTAFSPALNAVLSMGFVRTNQQVYSRSRFIRLQELPVNGPIEYRPTVNQGYETSSLQGDFSLRSASDRHAPKFGFVYQKTDGGETEQFTPQSQVALNALTNFSPFIGNRLLPRILPNSESVPVLVMDRDSDYLAAYGQDTWRFNNDLRINAGVRIETYKQTNAYAIGTPNRNPFRGGNFNGGVRTSTASSARINALYQIPKSGSLGLGKFKLLRFGAAAPTVIRVSFNQLFTPALGQGNVGIGQTDAGVTALLPNKAQMTDQYDVSIERQLRRQSLKLGAYSKKSRDTLGFQQMILGPQMVAYSTVNMGRAKASGVELTYELNPRNFDPAPGRLEPYQGLAAFVSLANGTTKLEGSPGTYFAKSFDQKTTLTTGVGYTTPKGDVLGLSYYYGSGLAGSMFNNSGRQTSSEINLRLAAAPGRFAQNKNLGVELLVENLGNSRGLLNFDSAYAGTRFQQGRRWLLSLTGKY